MPSTAQTKADFEAIFTKVIERLEVVITFYRNLLIQGDDDIMHEGLFAFCDELQSLKRKIGDTKLAISERIIAVGNISQYIQDFVSDTTNFRNEMHAKTLPNRMLAILTKIETLIYMAKPDVTIIEDIVSKTSETEDENFFTTQQSLLTKMLADHPELNT